MIRIKLLTSNELRKLCPLKWHDKIPKNGLSFGVADVDFEGPLGITDFIKTRIDESFSFYQHQNGETPALVAIQEFFKDKDIQISTNQLQIIPGTMIGIYAAMKYASRREGRVVTLGPIYEPIHRHATDNNSLIDWINIDEKIDIDILTASVDSDTKMIAICNPTNPIGYTPTKSEIKAIRDLVVDHNIICFSDELYEPLVFSYPHTSALTFEELRERTICLYGFSKAYGLAGYRSGFIYAGTTIIEEIKEITNGLLVSPSPIASLVCEYALTDEYAKQWVVDFRNIMSKNTSIASKIFNKHGFQCKTPTSCFFVFPDLKIDDSILVTNLLENQGVQVVEGSKFGPTGKNHVRINCGTSEERLREGIERILLELQNY